MKLIAKKLCSFGGRKFYIGSEVPAELVANPKLQERLGVLVIVDEEVKGVSGEQPGTFFTQEQVDSMVAEAVEKAVEELRQSHDELQQIVSELQETEPEVYEGTIQIAVKAEDGGENEQVMAIPAKPEEIQQVFSIMQLNAEEGAKMIANVENENVLILLHAADSRSTIKNAAKKQADKLIPAEGDSNESDKHNETTGTNAEGADT